MRFFLKIIACFIIISCNKKETLFTSLTPSYTNINFNNTIENTQELNILNYLYFYNGSGVSAGDFNNDGLLDLYFTANQSADILYINNGDFKFKDVTEASGLRNAKNWTTGSTTVDINNDGLLDIYICKIGKLGNIEGRNLLYVNQGIENGVPKFKEEATKYKLDIKSLSTQAVFFDYDRDSDLDMYLLNHSVHPNSNYGKGVLRTNTDSIYGDKLFRNDDGTFTDVSDTSGIFQGKIGYGLGISVSDINNDGYPDIYIGNDFFENDYLYINQKDGTFKDIITSDKTVLGHTSHFSMGSAIEDLNNDGLNDIISLDMLPEDLETYKSSGLEYPYPNYENYLKNGYAPQFMQNTLHFNNGNNTFSETAHLGGIAATEWSWSPIIGDYDNDGYKDLYITNGILGATNDMDFINFISNEKIQKRLGPNMEQKDVELVNNIPKKKVSNYIFKNNGDRVFTNMTSDWSESYNTYSNGGVYADLDNDGDLDIIINNINEPALILINNSEKIKSKNTYLKLSFRGQKNNTFGIGVKVKAFVNHQIITSENYTTKGYLSSVAPEIHLGTGKASKIDSLHIFWPSGELEKLYDVATNQNIEINYTNASNNIANNTKKPTSLLSNTKNYIDVIHKDQTSIEFSREPLVPFASTNKGPDISVADINNDGLDDVFFSGSKSHESKLFIQYENGVFKNEQDALLSLNAISEDVSHIFFNANSDDYKDLLIVSGGNEFVSGDPLHPRLYINEKGMFKRDTTQFNNIAVNASKVTSVDFDNDGDQDICITSNLMPRKFGKTPKQYLFLNDGEGNFEDISSSVGQDFVNVGNVEDIIWIDINADGFNDAVITGKWMPIQIFLNDGKKLTLQKDTGLNDTHGWWNAINAADFDNDGDIDLVAGNWGMNTRLKASKQQPITLYNFDFDDNEQIDPIVTYYYQDQETPFASKDELVKQLPFLNKKFLLYKDFAKADLTALFSKSNLFKAEKKYVYTLSSSYFENQGDHTFKIHQLPFECQVSSINSIYIDDYNKDGFFDIFLAGNDYEISTQLGKLDASHGSLLLNNKSGFFKVNKHQGIDVAGPARNINKIVIDNETYYIVSINNGAPIFLKKNDE